MNENRQQEIVIEVKDIAKKFKAYTDKANSLKERVINPSRGRHEDIMVLKGISFNVKKGEAVGIIGKNGCGKSTTLKLLTKILYPDAGRIDIKGRVSSLIELGAGFHPDMTGRENIYTNASIFGISRKEVRKRLDDIIRFSELEEFIDNPVRTYSSGMYMRLAFAVAINVDADVLLIDEILAVGDSAFQKKCFEKLKEIKMKGTTIVIVSHSMDQMYMICDRLIWLEGGIIKDEGAPRIIGEKYTAVMEGKRLERIELENRQRKEELERKIKEEQERRQKEELAEMERSRQELACNETLKEVCSFYQPGARRKIEGAVKYTRVVLKDADGIETNKLLTGQTYELDLDYRAEEKCENIHFVIGITRDDGIYCYGTYVDVENEIPSEGTVSISFTNGLLKGKYVLDLWIETREYKPLDSIYSLMSIEVDTAPYEERGILSMAHEWRVCGSGSDKKNTHIKTVAENELCGICGKIGRFEIDREAVLLREANCEHCHASLRNSDVAKQIVAAFGGRETIDLRKFVQAVPLRILNTCSSGYIHEALKDLDGYIASEYFDDIPNGERKGEVVSVDLQNIPFPEAYFDLVISEDVFEHISDYKRAFSEVYRVLKPKGRHIFTVPIHEGRETVSRQGNSKVIYHGDPLHEEGSRVCTDFGDDILQLVDEAGFKSTLVKAHGFYEPGEITDCDASYEEYLTKTKRLDTYFKYNSLVIDSYKE